METRAGISITTESVFTVALRYTDEFVSQINRIKIKIVSHYELVMKEHISHSALTKKHIAQNIFDLFHNIKKKLIPKYFPHAVILFLFLKNNCYRQISIKQRHITESQLREAAEVVGETGLVSGLTLTLTDWRHLVTRRQAHSRNSSLPPPPPPPSLTTEKHNGNSYSPQCNCTIVER